MENSPSISEQPLSNLTAADLEILITQIVQKVIKQEIQKQQPIQTDNPLQNFLETFGSWEDTRTTEQIIDDIYINRTVGE
jgi:hypothetical protein